MPLISISCPIHPTEDTQKVMDAVSALFPDANFDSSTTQIIGVAVNLDHFQERLKNQQIRDTARNILLKGSGRKVIKFNLNKQAALMNKVNFTDGKSVLGDIEVTIEDDDVQSLIDELTSTVEKGGDHP